MKKQKTDIYYFGKNEFNLSPNQNPEKQIAQVYFQKNIQSICGGNTKCLIITTDGQLYKITSRSHEVKKMTLDSKFTNETFKSISHGFHNGLALTHSGKVFFIGTNNEYKQQPLRVINSEPDKACCIDWLLEKDILIRYIACGSLNFFYISFDNVLYGNGYNSEFQLGIRRNQNEPFPLKISENVDKVFSSCNSVFSFFTTLDGKLYGMGRNTSGCLGIGHKHGIGKAEEVKGIFANLVQKIVCTFSSSFILTKDGKVFACGTSHESGLGKETFLFVPIPELRDVIFTDITSGTSHVVAITTSNELYGWGGALQLCQTKTYIKPVKINSTILPKNMEFELSYSRNMTFILPQGLNQFLNSDFLILLENHKFSDYTINNVKVHKLLLECRLNQRPIKEIEQILINYSESDLKKFFKWVYSGNISDYSLIDEICQKFRITNFYKKSFQTDLFSLFKNEDSKNFNLLIKIEDEDEGEFEDGNYEEIPVHKFVLYAKSGLFREMFDKIDENSNSVTDYSHKTIESVEILIKYFYSNKIELTADDDPELVVEELSDAVDYYQLNTSSELPYILKRLKSQFNIN
ncbi:hypothetical protein M0813_10552 [Anaeramoeba flamelloides]|uniref:BTB domain-containing protein n=1 Tax=Anaeramoeba flamelloides TaxID=1746091 RepID=A0ABQ8X1Y5_9EUKA|nr:hypothetical protein M0813_10552 [Anaeramoeba flamelloides]